ncbi:MAG: 50S ribosomal protein L13 [Candidatus Omnitrophica bacterium]|jgi:large subunit ribosomal protein L13|nr:50S ribosomal protein L13 [Candidatus Omnitrophota bacterium]
MKRKNTKFFNQEERKWVLIDAKDKILGRLATRIAKILQGKNKATYTPNFLCGDRVIVINAKHIKFTANKYSQDKIYDKYTGYPSGRKVITLKTLKEKNPSKVLYLAVKGMLPKSNLGWTMLKSLKIYPEAEYEQKAQKPELINV